MRGKLFIIVAIFIAIVASGTVSIGVIAKQIKHQIADREREQLKKLATEAENRKFERDMRRDLEAKSLVMWPPGVLDDFEEFEATDGKKFSPSFQFDLKVAIARQHMMRREALRKESAQ